MMEFAGLLYRSGIPIEAGTDSMAGFALHRELEFDVEAGIPARQVLQNATLNAARIMSLDKELGSIAPGKLADLTLVDGNPAANISDIRKTVLVVKDGVLYQSAELYSELGDLDSFEWNADDQNEELCGHPISPVPGLPEPIDEFAPLPAPCRRAAET
jgi:hypothetical protein